MRIQLGALGAVTITDGTDSAGVIAAAATQNEALADYLKTLAAVYGFNGTDLARIGAIAAGADGRTNTINSLESAARLEAYNGATWDRLRSEGNDRDAITATTLGSLQTLAFPHAYNGTTWDRYLSKQPITALASASRTATTQSADIETYNARGVVGFINLTTHSGSDTISLQLQCKDDVGNQYNTIVNQNAFSSASMSQISVYPGTLDQENSYASGYEGSTISKTVRVQIWHSGSEAFTYSVVIQLIP